MATKVIAIVGPTATGKTDLAIRLAKKTGGEIINCDSRQVYKMMDIGTNKGLISRNEEFINFEKKKLFSFDLENSGINGWLFDIVDTDEQLTLADYQKVTQFMIESIRKRGKVPILVGGTGLYFDALIRGYELSGTKPDLMLRMRLAKLNVKELFIKLLELNKDKALSLNNSDANNPRRLMRAIEESRSKKGQEKNILQAAEKNIKIDPFIIYPLIDRDVLYQKLEARVLEMVSEGLVKETSEIIGVYGEDLEVLKGIGYKEVIQYLQEKITIAEMIFEIQKGHKNYAKRQITWFEGEDRNYQLKKYNFDTEKEKVYKDVENFLKIDT